MNTGTGAPIAGGPGPDNKPSTEQSYEQSHDQNPNDKIQLSTGTVPVDVLRKLVDDKKYETRNIKLSIYGENNIDHILADLHESRDKLKAYDEAHENTNDNTIHIITGPDNKPSTEPPAVNPLESDIGIAERSYRQAYTESIEHPRPDKGAIYPDKMGLGYIDHKGVYTMLEHGKLENIILNECKLLYDNSKWYQSKDGYYRIPSMTDLHRIISRESRIPNKDAPTTSQINSTLRSMSTRKAAQTEWNKDPYIITMGGRNYKLIVDKDGEFVDVKLITDNTIKRNIPGLAGVIYEPHDNDDSVIKILDQYGPNIRRAITQIIVDALMPVRRRDCIYHIQGNGKNGKSTAIEWIQYLFGDDPNYVGTSIWNMKDQSTRATILDRHINFIDDGNRLDLREPFAESMYKSLATNGWTSARHHFKEDQSVKANSTTVFVGNKAPIESNTDFSEGLDRRGVYIYMKEKLKKDITIPEKLRNNKGIVYYLMKEVFPEYCKALKDTNNNIPYWKPIDELYDLEDLKEISPITIFEACGVKFNYHKADNSVLVTRESTNQLYQDGMPYIMPETDSFGKRGLYKFLKTHKTTVISNNGQQSFKMGWTVTRTRQDGKQISTYSIMRDSLAPGLEVHNHEFRYVNPDKMNEQLQYDDQSKAKERFWKNLIDQD